MKIASYAPGLSWLLCLVRITQLVIHTKYQEKLIKIYSISAGIILRTVLMVLRIAVPWFCFSVIAVTLGGIINVCINYFPNNLQQLLTTWNCSYHLIMIQLMIWTLLKWRDFFRPISMMNRNTIRICISGSDRIPRIGNVSSFVLLSRSGPGPGRVKVRFRSGGSGGSDLDLSYTLFLVFTHHPPHTLFFPFKWVRHVRLTL